MFDIGFSELVMVALVALIVIGPERLPKVARVAGMWVGRARRTLASVKQEIDRELRADELTDMLKRQTRLDELERILDEPLKPPASTTPTPPQGIALELPQHVLPSLTAENPNGEFIRSTARMARTPGRTDLP